MTGGIGTWAVGGGYLQSGEIYDPASRTFAATGSLHYKRWWHTATLRIPSLASAGLYDPSGTTFTPTSNMLTPRSEHSATRLNDGSVLVAGGIDWTSQARTVLVSAELYYSEH